MDESWTACMHTGVGTGRVEQWQEELIGAEGRANGKDF